MPVNEVQSILGSFISTWYLQSIYLLFGRSILRLSACLISFEKTLSRTWELYNESLVTAKHYQVSPGLFFQSLYEAIINNSNCL